MKRKQKSCLFYMPTALFTIVDMDISIFILLIRLSLFFIIYCRKNLMLISFSSISFIGYLSRYFILSNHFLLRKTDYSMPFFHTYLYTVPLYRFHLHSIHILPPLAFLLSIYLDKIFQN